MRASASQRMASASWLTLELCVLSVCALQVGCSATFFCTLYG